MLGMALTLMALQGAAAPLHEAEHIFPPNPKHNHGSSVVETRDGDLLVCWFHGSGERKEDDVLIQGARRRSGSADWSEPFLMADSQDLPDCNPVLFVDPRGTLWLFWIAILNNEWGGSLLKYRTATDYAGDGPPVWDWQDVIHCRPARLEELFIPYMEEAERNFADMIAQRGIQEEVAAVKEAVRDKLASRLGWMTRLRPIMLSETRMMLGLYSDVFNCSLAAFTEDWGTTWAFSEPILGLGNIQPSFVLRRGGEIDAMMRDNGPFRRIRRSRSHDGGQTWAPVASMDIPNPGASVECIVLENGHWALVCNDTTEGRHRLSVFLSEDEGATWPWSRALEEHEPGAASASYPSVLQTRDGALHCTYSFTSREFTGSTIKHARFNEEWVRAGTP